MSGAAAKLAGFATGIALVFGAAVALGDAVGPVREGGESPAADEHGAMGEMAAGGDAAEGAHAEAGGHAAADPVRGLAVSDDGLTLRLGTARVPADRKVPLRFRIVGAGGATVKDFDLEHTKRMHVIVVRRDLTGFQHLHPTQAADGEWSVPLRLAEPGAYRVFADFSHDGTAETLAADLQVDGPVRTRSLPAPAATAAVDGYEVRMAGSRARAGQEAELAFTVTRGGRTVAVADYLGAKGHLVALREGDLAFLHVHPDEDRLRFMASFPSAGRYRLFLQFKAGGEVHTVAFTEEVSR
ncbi:MAG TPA: hypothetical protein VEB65_00240 [Solirubrobacterales bacterium]|nr:hypothetical protein [Solirubrobacterales bacterium]